MNISNSSTANILSYSQNPAITGWETIKSFLKENDFSIYSNENIRLALENLNNKISNDSTPAFDLSHLPEDILEFFSQASLHLFFHALAFYNQTSLLKFFLLDPPMNINNRDDSGCTPFFIACEKGFKDVVELLLSSPEIDINIKAVNGQTPFHTACSMNNCQIVEILLRDERLEINKLNSHGAHALYIACRNGQNDVVNLLLEDWRIDFNQVSPNGETPLFVACQKGHTQTVRLLISQARVDVNIPTHQGWTPLLIAFRSRWKQIVELLLLLPEIDVNPEFLPLIPAKFAANLIGWGHITSFLLDCFGVERISGFKTGKIKSKINVFTYINDKVTWSHQKDFAKEIATIYAAKTFVLKVLLCDEYLTFKHSSPVEKRLAPDTSETHRYFLISQQLPMELQMLLTNRLYGLSKNSILSTDSEKAFRQVFRSYQPL